MTQEEHFQDRGLARFVIRRIFMYKLDQIDMFPLGATTPPPPPCQNAVPEPKLDGKRGAFSPFAKSVSDPKEVVVSPCSHAQQEHSRSPVQRRAFGFASKPPPQNLHHGRLQTVAAAKELLHLRGHRWKFRGWVTKSASTSTIGPIIIPPSTYGHE